MEIQMRERKFYVEIEQDHIKRMGWKEGTNVYIGKFPEKDILYIEQW